MDHSTRDIAAEDFHRRVRYGYALGLLGTTLFSMKSIIVKLIYASGVEPDTLLALRFAIAFPVYLFIGALSARQPPQTERSKRNRLMISAMGLGILGYWLSSYLDFLGLQYIGAQFERMILFTYPLLVMILGFLIFGQRLPTTAILASLISYFGLFLLFVQGAQTGEEVFKGSSLVFCSALTFALYQLYAKPVVMGLGASLSTSIMMAAACAASIAVFLLRHDITSLILPPWPLALVAFLSLAGTVMPSFLLNMALARISSQANASIGTLGPIITIALAAAFLGEQVNILDACGMVLVIIGVGWFSVAESPRGVINISLRR